MAVDPDPESKTPDRDDAFWMRRALEIAEKGLGRVEPNPMVGCVVVKDHVELSYGWHERFGGPHAEVNALVGLSREELAQSTVYLTLEPCAHHGKTPPCVELLLARPPQRVVVAMLDPFPEVAGRGIAALEQAGIPVTVGVLAEESRWLNAPYLKRLRTGLPWVIAKWAMTLDGAIATRSGDSKWITGVEARSEVHRMRSRMDAIVVGSETVICDDPLLTARPDDVGCHVRPCVRVVMDRRFRIPTDCQLVRTGAEKGTIVVANESSLQAQSAKRRILEDAGVEVLSLPHQDSINDADQGASWELRRVLTLLSDRGATNVLVEGGGKILGAFFDASIVDQVVCYIAPRILGSEACRRAVNGKEREWMNQSHSLQRTSIRRIGGDLQITGFMAQD